MRLFLFSSAIILSLFLSHTAVMAQDDFQKFRDTLSHAKKAFIGTTPQTPEELQALMEQEQEEQKIKFMEATLAHAVAQMDLADQKKQADEAAFEGMIPVDSKIQAVTVYNDRARVTRTATVTLPAGASTVVFKNLPPYLLPDSLRAEGTADANVKFGALSHREIMLSQLASPREMELFSKLEPLEDQMKFLKAEGLAIESQSTFLASVGLQALARPSDDGKNKGESPLKPEQWATAGKNLRLAVSEAMKASVEQELKQRDLEREISKVRREFLGLRTDKRSNFAVMLPLEAESATKLTIKLIYQVKNATWKPLYDAHLNSAGKDELKIIQYGSVKQQTGEDWSHVDLTLSTSQPQRGTTLPELRAKWVDAFETAKPVPVSASGDPLQEWRAKAEARRLSLESETAPPEEDVRAPDIVPMVQPIRPQPTMRLGGYVDFHPANLQTGGYVSEYKIPEPSIVLSDGTETKLLIGKFDADTKVEVQIKPEVSTDAFIVAEATVKGDSPLLPGQVTLYRDDAYVGQLEIPLVRSGEEYGFYFGIDDKVSVKRETLEDKKQEEGIITKDNVIARQYVTEIENLHTSPVSLVVKEIMPTTKNEKVKVEVSQDITTPGFQADADNIKGLLSWAFEMQPKEKKELKLGWAVNWPKDHTLTGLQ